MLWAISSCPCVHNSLRPTPDQIVTVSLQEKQKQAGSGEPGAAAAEAQPAAKQADSKRKTQQVSASAKPAAKPLAKPVAKATADKPAAAAAASHKVRRWCCSPLPDCTALWNAHFRPDLLQPRRQHCQHCLQSCCFL